MGISLKNKEEYEGKILNNKSGEPFKIISYNSTNNVEIKFLNTSEDIYNALYEYKIEIDD